MNFSRSSNQTRVNGTHLVLISKSPPPVLFSQSLIKPAFEKISTRISKCSRCRCSNSIKTLAPNLYVRKMDDILEKVKKIQGRRPVKAFFHFTSNPGEIAEIKSDLASAFALFNVSRYQFFQLHVQLIISPAQLHNRDINRRCRDPSTGQTKCRPKNS